MKSIPYGRHLITDEDIQAVVEVLKSDFLTQGPKIAEFELEFAKYIGCTYAVAVSSGTAALHLCALALGIKPGNKIITTPITFAASANCVRYCDGDLVFSDIDPYNYVLDVNKVKELLNASPKGTFKGIIPVDFAGFPVNMEEFRKIADEHELWIIEDACHAPGAYFHDSTGRRQNCGNGIFADLSVFSFHPVKHIATGEGGMITTNNKKLYEKIIFLRTHGINKEPSLFKNSIEFASGSNLGLKLSANKSYPRWYYEMQELGFNYRLTDFQAALGLSQLKRAPSNLQKRREIAVKYEKIFKTKSYIKGQSGEVDGHGYHLYIIEVDNRKELFDYLVSHNIFVQIHYIPVHLMPYYKNFGWEEGDFLNAENFYRGCLSLPMYPSLSVEEQDYVINLIISFFENV